MPIIIAIDFGEKRTGIATSDPLQLIASGLTTLKTKDVIPFLVDYSKENEIEKCVIGLPKQRDNSSSPIEEKILDFIDKLKSQCPSLPIKRYDERFTSKIAFQTMLDSGISKKKRQDKALIDKISATLLLQSYLNYSK